jgi:hypothetical protein
MRKRKFKNLEDLDVQPKSKKITSDKLKDMTNDKTLKYYHYASSDQVSKLLISKLETNFASLPMMSSRDFDNFLNDLFQAKKLGEDIEKFINNPQNPLILLVPSRYLNGPLNENSRLIKLENLGVNFKLKPKQFFELLNKAIKSNCCFNEEVLDFFIEHVGIHEIQSSVKEMSELHSLIGYKANSKNKIISEKFKAFKADLEESLNPLDIEKCLSLFEKDHNHIKILSDFELDNIIRVLETEDGVYDYLNIIFSSYHDSAEQSSLSDNSETITLMPGQNTHNGNGFNEYEASNEENPQALDYSTEFYKLCGQNFDKGEAIGNFLE